MMFNMKKRWGEDNGNGWTHAWEGQNGGHVSLEEEIFVWVNKLRFSQQIKDGCYSAWAANERGRYNNQDCAKLGVRKEREREAHLRRPRPPLSRRAKHSPFAYQQRAVGLVHRHEPIFFFDLSCAEFCAFTHEYRHLWSVW